VKALDTNVVVRFLVADDVRQAQRVRQLLEDAEKKGEAFFVPQAVQLETLWVLSSVYAYGREEILKTLEALTQMPVLTFEKPDQLHRLILMGRQTKMGLADLLIGIAARAHACEATLTFDRSAAASELFELVRA
jgi:predicted nucleic-acid-binding protein